jgi:ABC-type nitrate/sulfonate/bicarbonate transport system permease component
MITAGTLFSDLRDSLWRLLAGLLVGSAVGIFIGLLTGRIKLFTIALSPIIQILRPLPAVAIIPLVIVWFGIDEGAKIFSISFAVFFPVWINTHIGARQIPRAFLWGAKLLTTSSTKIFREVVFPAALPFTIAGIRTGIAIAFIMVFVSELAGASSGLGYRISITHLAYRIDEMIAALAVLGALGAIADQLFVFATHKFFPWIKLSST